MNIISQIVLGVLFANLVDVLVHKYILHGLGKKKDSFFSYHWKNHHNTARKFDFYDPGYTLPWWNWENRLKEILGIVLLCFLVSPFWFYFQIFTLTLWAYAVIYLVLHRHMHLRPEFAKKYFKNHWNHHCKGNQEHSWGVLLPLWDYILGTKK